jgi:hypothetical protein
MINWQTPVIRNETERFLAERAGLTVCECGGIMTYPGSWNNANPPLICSGCGKQKYNSGGDL